MEEKHYLCQVEWDGFDEVFRFIKIKNELQINKYMDGVNSIYDETDLSIAITNMLVNITATSTGLIGEVIVPFLLDRDEQEDLFNWINGEKLLLT